MRQTLFAELKRRQVLRVVGAYAVVARRVDARTNGRLEGLLQTQAPRQRSYDPIARKLLRAKILAHVSRTDAAIDKLRAAQPQGNRMLWDFDYFQRRDHAPAFSSLRGDARCRAIIADLESDDGLMRERALHSTDASKEG